MRTQHASTTWRCKSSTKPPNAASNRTSSDTHPYGLVASLRKAVYKPLMWLQPTIPTSRRVLIVEDHEDASAMLVELMSNLGSEVLAASNGPDALAIAKSFCPEVVLLDIELAGMSGYEVAQALREDAHTRDALVVAVTGNGTLHERVLALDAGIDLHLVKPVPLDRLIEVLAIGPALTPAARQASTILVVDDNAAGRYATSHGLSKRGFKVIEAISGRGAVEKVGEATAIVLDVILPDVDGRELCRLLRTQAATALIPIVHLSALRVTDSDADAGRHAGADAYLVSPVSSEMLARILDSLIAAKRR
jgi:CheY-like chemotaxis protein